MLNNTEISKFDISGSNKRSFLDNEAQARFIEESSTNLANSAAIGVYAAKKVSGNPAKLAIITNSAFAGIISQGAIKVSGEIIAQNIRNSSILKDENIPSPTDINSIIFPYDHINKSGLFSDISDLYLKIKLYIENIGSDSRVGTNI